MLPKQYGGGGLSNVDFVIAAEEICAVDPGFATTILVNGLGLMPVWYYGTEEQKERFISRATSDTSGEFIVGYAASEPPGSPGGTANFDAPAVNGAGMAVTADLDGDEYVVNGRKYWPCNVGGWDKPGRRPQPRHRPHRPRGRWHPSAVGAGGGTGDARRHLLVHQHVGSAAGPELRDCLRRCSCSRGQPDRGDTRQR